MITSNRYAAIEREIPQAMRIFGLLLSMGMDFEAALRELARVGGALGGQLAQVLRRVDNGATMSEALLWLSSSVPSKYIARMVSALILSYTDKGDPEAIEALADDMLRLQLAQSREYTQKVSFYSVLFVIVAAVLPAMFQAFAIIGSAVMSITLTEMQAMLIMCCLFPLMDAAILVLMFYSRPVLV